MDPLHFSVAIIPVAIYLLLLGALNLRKRPFVTSGARDCAALAIGMVGLMIVGPMKLFFPESAASRFGILVWLMLLIFYGLCVSLTVLLMRSRIVVYNVSAETLRPILTSVARSLDKNSRWNGDALWMPERRLQLHVEPITWMSLVELTAGGNRQSYEAWRILEKELARELSKIPVSPNPFGVLFMVASGGLMVAALSWMLWDQAGVANAFRDLLMI